MSKADIKGYKSGSIVWADKQTAEALRSCASTFNSPLSAGWNKIKHNPSRTVWQGRLPDGREVFLKQFHSRSTLHNIKARFIKSDAKREFEFSRILEANGIATPKVLAYRSDNLSNWILTESLNPALPLDKWHEQQINDGAAGKRRIRLCITMLADLLAKMHAAGIEHQDLHCGNIFLSKHDNQVQLAVMDLHRIRLHRVMFRRRRSINLALLMHDRLPSTTRTERLKFLRTYIKSSGVKGTLRGWQWLVEFFWEKHAGRLHRQRDRRVLGRKNLYFTRIKLKDHWKGHVILASKRQMLDSQAAKMEFRIIDWQQLLRQPEKLLVGDDVEVIKESPSVRVVRRMITIGDKQVDVHIKQAKRKKKFNTILDCLRPCRAVNAFKLGHMFLTRRIPTPLPIAALERRVGPFLTDSILITETLPSPNLQRFMTFNLTTQPAKAVKSPEWEKYIYRTMENLGKALQYMHDMGFTHRDLKATNIKIFINKDNVPEAAFLDLDAVRKEFRVLLRQRYKGLTRVFVALQQCHTLTHTGFMRLLMSYMRRPGSGELYYKPYWRLIERWGEKKLQKQIKSRRKKQKAERKWFFTRKRRNVPAV